MSNKYKLLMNITVILLVANILISFITNLWKETNYPDYINSILFLSLILLASQVYSKKKD
jgi:magnesium-transporting ATPase (P-type)